MTIVETRAYEGLPVNAIQAMSQQIESDRLKLQMGLSPEIDIDTLTLRAMWQRLCRENARNQDLHPVCTASVLTPSG
jgi:hypothetical protein